MRHWEVNISLGWVTSISTVGNCASLTNFVLGAIPKLRNLGGGREGSGLRLRSGYEAVTKGGGVQNPRKPNYVIVVWSLRV